MLQAQDLIDILSAVAVIIVISVFITLAWMSTYVRDQPLVATAVVVFQQESSSPSAMSTPTASTSTCESSQESLSPQNSQSESQSMTTTSQEPEVDQGSLDVEDVKVLSEQTELDTEEKCNNSQQNSNSTSSKIKKRESTSNEEISPSQTVDNVVQDDKEVSCSSSLEPRPVPEEGYCEHSGSLLRHRSKSTPVKENILQESVPESDLNRTIEAEAEVQYEHLPEESIRIKLKFLDDTQRLVRGQLTDEVGSFKRANFNPELASNRVVRLIFNGQLLNRDNSTLGHYGLFDNCVVHCHISQPQPTNSNEMNGNSSNQENDGLDLSEILSPLLVVVVAFLWYLRYEYSHIFNTSATVILVCLTAMLLISQYAFTISFNVSWTYERGTNRGSTTSQPTASTVETGRDEEPTIQQNITLTSSRESAEGGATAQIMENNSADGRSNSSEESSSKSEISLPSQTPSGGEASLTVTNSLASAETVLLNS